jgi:hypothetical protein
MRRQLLRLSPFALIAVTGCADSPIAPDRETGLFHIQDAVHSAGNARFFFLPPLVPPPSFSGEFDPSVSPVVEICEWTGSACVMPLVAAFTTADGPGSETVRVVPEDEHYVVNWHTDQFALDGTKTYRIRVMSPPDELGHADVDVVNQGQELRNVNTGEFIPLLNGRTLPIKFRIEEGAFLLRFIFAGQNIRGLAYGNAALWVTHSELSVGDVVRISKVDPTTGEVLQQSGDLHWNGRGIALGAGSVWVVDAAADVIHRLDPSTLTPISSFGTPGSEPTGLAFDGATLWLTDPFFQRTYNLSLTGQVIGGFTIPNFFRQGLEWENAGMWMTTGVADLAFYLPDGTITATRTLQGLPDLSGGDIALGDGRVYIAAVDRVYVQTW